MKDYGIVFCCELLEARQYRGRPHTHSTVVGTFGCRLCGVFRCIGTPRTFLAFLPLVSMISVNIATCLYADALRDFFNSRMRRRATLVAACTVLARRSCELLWRYEASIGSEAVEALLPFYLFYFLFWELWWRCGFVPCRCSVDAQGTRSESKILVYY